MMKVDWPLEISEEKKKELSIGLLREWWMTTVHTLTDAIGPGSALVHLKPYYINSGRAGAINIVQLTGLPTDNAGELLAVWIGIANARISEGKIGIRESSKDLAFAEVSGCETKGVNREACYCFCVFTCSGINEVNQHFETELIRSIPWGDDNCCFRTIRTGAETSVKPKTWVVIPKISSDLTNYLGLAYCGEFWTDATRANIDALGSDEAIKRLKVVMNESGMTVGKKIVEMELKESSIGNVIHLLNELHQKKESCSWGKDSSSGEVTDCPFSSSPPEMCYQYEAFFNGICEVIDPDYEFVYDRMMTKGDDACHWMIRKKMEPVQSQEQRIIKESSETPLELLKKRFVKGEITPEQYRQYRDILLEK
jgi:predicted hydrocarbon binding protein